MNACVLHAPGDIRYERIPDPEPGPGEVLIRVEACGVCGSDVPRIFVKGGPHMPLIPGHEFAGTVEAWGPGVDCPALGTRVTVFPLIPCGRCAACEIGAFAQCADYDYLGSRRNGAFAEYVTAPAANCHALPGELPFEQAAMTEPAAVALHAVRRGGLSGGDRAVIFGAGPVGLLVAQWARIHGAATVALVDIDPQKFAAAEALGFRHCCPALRESPRAFVARLLGDGADLVVEATGAAAALEEALYCARPFASVALLGNPEGDMPLSQQAYWQVLRQELRLVGCWNSTTARLAGNEWNRVLHAMATGLLNAVPLISHRCALDTLPAMLQGMRDRKETFVKVMALPGGK